MTRLRSKGLQVGLYEPKFDDPAGRSWRSQTPDPGPRRAKGSGVDLAIDPATATTATTPRHGDDRLHRHGHDGQRAGASTGGGGGRRPARPRRRP